MVLGTIFFLLGVMLLQQQSELPGLNWCWAAFLVILIPFLPSYSRYTIMLILGFVWALFRAHLVLDIALPTELEGKDIQLTGVISSIPQTDKDKTRFEFDIEKTNLAQALSSKPIPALDEFNAKVQLSWYNNYKNSRSKSKNKPSTQQPLRLKAGQRWQFWVRLKQPHGFMNPGGFDYEGWLYQKKIRATGYIRLKGKNGYTAKLIDHQVESYPVLLMRQKLYDKLKEILDTPDYAGILLALAMGERNDITQEQWQVFRATGTSHLVAISGLHIGLLAGFVFFLAKRVWPYCGSAALYLAAPRAAALIALVIGAAYAALSGFAVPAQRALLMLAIVMLSLFWLRKVKSAEVLSLALLAVLLLDPVAVLSIGFWLSFAAVSIIAVVAFSRVNHLQNRLIWIRLQWRISLVLVPVLLFFFQQASLVSPVTNLVAIPVISFIVVPMVLLAVIITTISGDFASVLFSLADTVINLLWWFLSHLSVLPWSQWQTLKPEPASFLLAVIGMILLASPKGWPGKYWGFVLLLPLIWPKQNILPHAEAEITLLDVGQGLSSVIKTKHHTLVFDTGAKYSQKFDAGAAVVLPFLRQKNIKHIDMLILSHQDNDHRGGYGSIKDKIEVLDLLSSHKEPGSRPCLMGQHWTWDGVYFEILNPSAVIKKQQKRNNASCVLKVSVNKENILMTADIEKKAEFELVNSQKSKLQAKYLVVPHHGSKTSSSGIFLDAVQPEYAFIPVGYRNRYRMPHADVLLRYQNRQIKILQTAHSGAVTIKLGQKNNSFEPKAYRKQFSKYWNSHH